MLKRTVLFILSFLISFHFVVALANTHKAAKDLSQEVTKDLSETESKETSEKNSDVAQELVWINHSQNKPNFILPKKISILYHDYNVLYQSLPRKVPTVPPSHV